MAWIIETTDDLIRALRENEEFREAARRELLTQDLIELPGEFREFKSDVYARFDGVDARFDGVDARFDGVDARFDGVDARFDGVDARFDDVYARFDGVYARFDGVDARFDGVDARLSSLEDGQGDLKGIGLETKLYNRGPSLIATLLRVRRSERVRVAERDANSEEFNDEIDNALDSGVITDSEYERVLRTDTIIRSRRRETSNIVYTAIESSYSVSRDDIQKVNDTAAILGRIFPEAEVHAALYYVNIASFIEEEADRSGVHLIQTGSIT